ncbi:hypothetical protein [Paenibacillus sp. P22]|uniref:hypothetical protein n=1 Tax=Paenibacillus sp. P22 TaxID=483908 RepID=UPI0003903CE4|nr:hypothetical protein [Paenibacillus sp. P22]CDN45989.1 hypothetical protein BN871_JW_00020 [Paenibacillus sp. P22]
MKTKPVREDVRYVTLSTGRRLLIVSSENARSSANENLTARCEAERGRPLW